MLARCHRKLEDNGAALLDALDQLAAGQDGGARDTVHDVLAFFRRTGDNHIADEEQSLFPRLGEDALTERLRQEHREHERLLGDLEAAVGRWPSDLTADHVAPVRALAAALDAAYRSHTALEDRELLPRLDGLDPDARAALTEEMQRRRDG